MSSLQQLNNIRDYINSNKKINDTLLQDLFEWNILTSAIDVVEDTEEAILEYDSVRPSYLELYGVLQAINVQQDAIEKLYIIIMKHHPGNSMKAFSNFEREYWEKIRKLRHVSVGHPCDCNSFLDAPVRVSGYVVRNALKDGFLELIIFNSDTNEDTHHKVFLMEWIDQYKMERVSIVKEIEDSLESWL